MKLLLDELNLLIFSASGNRGFISYKDMNAFNLGFDGIMEKLMNNVMYELPSRKDVKKCIITKDTVEKGEDPQLILEEPLLEEQPPEEEEREEE